MSYQLLIAGSRSFTDAAQLDEVMDRLVAQHRPERVIAGGAPGADRLAAAWARKRGIDVTVVPAIWQVDGKTDRSAGYKRNARMVAMLQPGDKAVIFYGPGTKSSGSADTEGRARAAAVDVRTFTQRPLDHAAAEQSQQMDAITAAHAQVAL